jgi:hypothetical protein
VTIDEQQVRHADAPEVPAERIDPEMIRPFGVARGDMPGKPLCKAISREKTKRAGEALPPVQPFLF